MNPERFLAPPWLPRQQRRHVGRALFKLSLREACSICGRALRADEPTAGGFDANGSVAVAGECCTDRLAQIFTIGVGFELPHDVADVARCGGVDRPLQVSRVDGQWKDDDRVWFEQNPKRSHRMRALFPGEFDGKIAEVSTGNIPIVLVRQVTPGSRLKGALGINADWLPFLDDEALIHALFEVMAGREPALDDLQQLFALAKKYTGRQT